MLNLHAVAYKGLFPGGNVFAKLFLTVLEDEKIVAIIFKIFWKLLKIYDNKFTV